MLSDAFQAVIPTTNWMYPAALPAGGLPAGFDTLIQPEKALILSSDDAAAMRSKAVDEWLNALSR